MSKARNRRIQKAIIKKMGIDPAAKALEIGMKNFKNVSAKSREPKRPGQNDPS